MTKERKYNFTSWDSAVQAMNEALTKCKLRYCNITLLSDVSEVRFKSLNTSDLSKVDSIFKNHGGKPLD